MQQLWPADVTDQVFLKWGYFYHLDRRLAVPRMLSFICLLVALSTAGCATVTVTIDPARIPVRQAVGQVPAAPELAFSTPEDAISQYIAGIAEGDVDKILAVAASDEMAEYYRADLFVERLGGVLIPFTMLAPADYPYYVAMNKVQQTARILSQVRNFSYSLLSDEDIASAQTIVGVDAERMAKFIADIDPVRLADIAVTDISAPSMPAGSVARYEENAAKIAKIFGADEYAERVVSFSFEGVDYLMGFQLLRYGDNWKVMDQSSPLGNTSALGVPTRQ